MMRAYVGQPTAPAGRTSSRTAATWALGMPGGGGGGNGNVDTCEIWQGGTFCQSC